MKIKLLRYQNNLKKYGILVVGEFDIVRILEAVQWIFVTKNLAFEMKCC